ncbi:MAG: prolyl oligopeptidase family serine peptidase [Flavobacteriia bacterium]|jgi:dipeptidyl aminopeptidase/acylaminoacyl peptidase
MRFIFIALLPFFSLSQTIPNSSSLQLEEIMKGNEFVGFLPENIRWSVDGQIIYFDWNPNHELGNSTYAYRINEKGATPKKVDRIEAIEFDPSQSQFSQQYSSIDGALVVIDRKTSAVTPLYYTNEEVYNVQRTNSEHIVAFQQGNNLFLYNGLNGSISQITNFQSGNAKNEQRDSTFLMKEEQFLFEYIRDKNERTEWSNEQGKSRFSLPEPIYFGKEVLENLQINKSGKYVTVRFSTYPKERDTEVEHHISEDGNAYTTPARAKVGAEEPSHRLGIFSTERDSIYFVDFSILSDIRKKPTYLNDTTPYSSDRKIVMHSLKFSSYRNQAVCDIRSYDNKDRWIVLINLETGKFIEIDHQYDEAWIGGPGISGWNTEEGTLDWIINDLGICFQSEINGFSQLYLYTFRTKAITPITRGKNWEVHNVTFSKGHGKLFITANKTHPGNRDFYIYSFATNELTPVLTKDGAHEVFISPDEKTLAVRYSSKNEPWELFSAPNTINSTLTQITHSTTEEFSRYKWREPAVIDFKGSDGTDVYARVYEPEKGKSNKAAVIFVHGAGYLQNAHNYWSNYYREYMFHNMLVDNGYTVLDIDYRASEGYGRDYRTAIYRHMGGRDLQDHIDGKQLLVNTYGIDSNRVGIYGGSYGGFITLMAMLTTPGQFTCGAALRSVTDWAHYNHEYTSNILNYPDTDQEAYRKSSPIYFAQNLVGRLLMLHGMVDDNVQFQDVVRLSQRFIELGKTNWDLAVFPIESHGFKEAYSWTNEYRRIYELFYNELILQRK